MVTEADELCIAPTVLVDVSPDSPIMQEEVFGPILPMLEIGSVEAVIQWINSPLQAVSLPAALVKVTITLPRYSDHGRYTVAVSRNQGGNDLVAKANAAATGNRDHEEVSVYLDLRKSQPWLLFPFQQLMSRIRPRTTILSN